MGHSHDHGTENMGDGKLIAAVAVNVLLIAGVAHFQSAVTELEEA